MINAQSFAAFGAAVTVVVLAGVASLLARPDMMARGAATAMASELAHERAARGSEVLDPGHIHLSAQDATAGPALRPGDRIRFGDDGRQLEVIAVQTGEVAAGETTARQLLIVTARETGAGNDPARTVRFLFEAGDADLLNAGRPAAASSGDRPRAL